MKKIFILAVVVLFCDTLVTGQAPICQANYFYQSGNPGTGQGCIWYHTADNPTLSVYLGNILPPNASGLAIGPKFNFNAPNPTYWTVKAGTYWYYDGSVFVDSGHSSGGTSFNNPGGSKNYVYNLDAAGQVSKYDGTGSATIIATFTNCTGSDATQDIVGDDNDNFYLLKTSSPQQLLVYSPLAVLTCSYNVTNCPTAYGFAINKGLISVSSGGASPGAYFGRITGNSINFSYSSILGCQANDLASCPAEVILTPQIRAVPSSSLPCMGGTIALTSDDAAGMNSYAWSGPGIVGAQTSQSVAVNAPGVYTRSLINCAGIADVSNFTVYNGNVQPLVPFQTALIKCVQDVPVTLSVSGLGNYTWAPAASLSSSTGSVVYASPGITTTYTVTGVVGACNGTTVMTILADPIPASNPVISNSMICEGSTATLTIASVSNLNYLWQPGNIPATSFAVNPSQTTTYSLVATNSLGCSQTETIGINVVSNPTITSIASHTEVCLGSNITITSTGASNFACSPGNNTGAMITVAPMANTIYTITGNNWICTDSKTIAVTVHALPTINCTALPPEICKDKMTILTASGALSYTFYPGSSTGASVSLSPSVNTIYTVTGSNTNCSNSKTLAIIVHPLPQLSLSISQSTICSGETVTLNATGADSYVWDSGSSNSQIAVTPAATTLYNLTGYTTFGCSSSASKVLTVDACTDIKEQLKGSNPFIYPNPGNGNFTLNKGNINGEPVIEVYNTIGQLIFMKRFSETGGSIDLGGSAPGMYILRLSLDGDIVYSSVLCLQYQN